MCFFFFLFPLPSEICVECESRENYFSPNRRTAVLLDHSVSLVQDQWMSDLLNIPSEEMRFPPSACSHAFISDSRWEAQGSYSKQTSPESIHLQNTY